jgi:hypothetical protein
MHNPGGYWKNNTECYLNSEMINSWNRKITTKKYSGIEAINGNSLRNCRIKNQEEPVIEGICEDETWRRISEISPILFEYFDAATQFAEYSICTTCRM